MQKIGYEEGGKAISNGCRNDYNPNATRLHGRADSWDYYESSQVASFLVVKVIPVLNS